MSGEISAEIRADIASRALADLNALARVSETSAQINYKRRHKVRLDYSFRDWPSRVLDHNLARAAERHLRRWVETGNTGYFREGSLDDEASQDVG